MVSGIILALFVNDLFHIMNVIYLSTYPEYLNCEFVAIPGKYAFIPNAYGFQKDSPYLDIFNYFITQLQESGSYEKISRKYESKSPICPDYSGKSLGLDSCVIMFLVVLMGLGLGFLFLLIECLLKYFIPDLNWFNLNPPLESSEFQELNLDFNSIYLNPLEESSEVQQLKFENQQLKQELRHVQNLSQVQPTEIQ
jgi:hypothetical protein